MSTVVTMASKAQKTETDIAVLQVQVHNIEEKVNDVKNDLKDIHDILDKNATETREILKKMSDSAGQSHNALSSKIASLEKWRWMMMGAGVVLGSLGFDVIAKLLQH